MRRGARAREVSFSPRARTTTSGEPRLVPVLGVLEVHQDVRVDHGHHHRARDGDDDREPVVPVGRHGDRARVPGRRSAFSFVSLARARTPGARQYRPRAPETATGGVTRRAALGARALRPACAVAVGARACATRALGGDVTNGTRRSRKSPAQRVSPRFFAPKTSAFEATNDARGCRALPWARTSWRARQGRSSGATGAWRGRRGRRRNRLDDVSRAGGEPRAPALRIYESEDRVVLEAPGAVPDANGTPSARAAGDDAPGVGAYTDGVVDADASTRNAPSSGTAARSSSTEGIDADAEGVDFFIPIPGRSALSGSTSTRCARCSPARADREPDAADAYAERVDAVAAWVATRGTEEARARLPAAAGAATTSPRRRRRGTRRPAARRAPAEHRRAPISIPQNATSTRSKLLFGGAIASIVAPAARARADGSRLALR